jgi:hypothetical protein
MDIDRRKLLIGTAFAALGSLGVGASSNSLPPDIPGSGQWHPLTRSLLERSRRANRCCDAPDKAMVERTIRQFAQASGSAKPPVIKWMDTATDAFDHLSRLGLDAVLDMGTTRFWRRVQPLISRDVHALDCALEVRTIANELLGVDEQDRLLMAPKLRAKSAAMSASASDEEVFRVRAVSSQIGWLETSMADAAAEAVFNVELLLCAGASDTSVAIDHQLKVFESYESGLQATWETTDALICVPRFAI